MGFHCPKSFMEQTWSAKFDQTSLSSHSRLHSYSQLNVRKRRLILPSSPYNYRLTGSSLCCRNPVNNNKLTQAFTGKGKSFKWVPEALGENVCDAFENEAEVEREQNIADGILNIVHATSREAAGTISDKGNENVERAEGNSLQPLKWPLWLLGPSMLLATAAIPILWLPFSIISPASNMASLLSLTGLDGTFNLGATIFLLVADYCARSKKGQVSYFKIPFSYMFWNFLLNVVGFVVPSLAIAASYRSIVEPQICLISFATMLGPYLMLLMVQMLAEILTWNWKSPVCLIVPVVYEAYRLLQLSRSLELGIDLNAPSWLMQGMKGLVAWWVLVLGMQLMKIAWFVGQGKTTKEA
ncbi:uncharacterized protein LOC131028732 [Cryptomeria japonica]|uniref:uncharacterized protein LOC131028732 n=1 Tax=Cryptomeria japonica TaxID=3369 RepID=UPI0027DA1BDB|nr:uncharacterized protein LOC131028732 [Cryptomeria japonica]XP_057815055.2 uncharacterized protein LOC131028732 [Cryptomeria japonica]XP_057815056.2 uncharacterized protein LOC131028732 [Cryptomeria japonica]